MCFRLVAGCRRESIPALRVPPLFLSPKTPLSPSASLYPFCSPSTRFSVSPSQSLFPPCPPLLSVSHPPTSPLLSLFPTTSLSVLPPLSTPLPFAVSPYSSFPPPPFLLFLSSSSALFLRPPCSHFPSRAFIFPAPLSLPFSLHPSPFLVPVHPSKASAMPQCPVGPHPSLSLRGSARSTFFLVDGEKGREPEIAEERK